MQVLIAFEMYTLATRMPSFSCPCVLTSERISVRVRVYMHARACAYMV